MQKERQYVKENKRKNQDLNAKLYSLRTQKFELDNKLMEMQSTIGSMKDEQRALELAIDEKQNEIKHKESEIKDLRSSLQTPPKIWSVSSDDPSNREVNSTDKITPTKVNSWFGQSSKQKPNQESDVEGNMRIRNPDVKVKKPKDSEKHANSREEVWGLNLDHKDDDKTEMHNTTNTVGSDDQVNGLSIKGRRSFIQAYESQRVKGERNAMGSITQTDGQTEETQLRANRKEGPSEITRFISGKRSIDQETKRKAETTDEDESEAEVDTKTSMESSTSSEADQDYKEETED